MSVRPSSSVADEVCALLAAATPASLRRFAAGLRDWGDEALLSQLRVELRRAVSTLNSASRWQSPPDFVHEGVCGFLSASDMLERCSMLACDWNRRHRVGWVAVHEDSFRWLRGFLCTRTAAWLSTVRQATFPRGHLPRQVSRMESLERLELGVCSEREQWPLGGFFRGGCRFARLRTLYLDYSDAADDDVRSIVLAAPLLASLSLHSTQVTDACSPHLARLEELDTLYIGSTDCGGLSLWRAIAELQVKKLQVPGCPALGSRELRALARLGGLTSLTMQRNLWTPDGLRHLASLPALTELGCSWSEGLVDVVAAGFPALRCLFLAGTTTSSALWASVALKRSRPTLSVVIEKTTEDSKV